MAVPELPHRFPSEGRLEWIGLSPGRRGVIRSVEEARIEPGTGLEGDYHSRSGRGKRQVTLVQREHLDRLEQILGRAIGPEELRRNLVVSGIDLEPLEGVRFRLGEAVLEGSGPCHPCSRMEENLGPGGLDAMRGRGGLTAIVHEGGMLRLGDAVRAEEPRPGEDSAAG